MQKICGRGKSHSSQHKKKKSKTHNIQNVYDVGVRDLSQTSEIY